MEVLYLIGCFGVGFPLHKPYPYRLHTGKYLHFRYLHVFFDDVQCNVNPGLINPYSDY